MPPLKDPLCTEKFLKGVLHREFWCLKAEEIHSLKVCPDLPSKKELASIVADAMESMGPVNEGFDNIFRRTAKLVRKKMPDRHWLIKVLSTVEKDHEIFQRTYKRPVMQRGSKQK